MGRIGTTELIVIFVIALLVFGPSKLPELGKLAGRTIGSVKRYVNTLEAEIESEENVSEEVKEQTSKEEVEIVKENEILETVTKAS